MKKFLSKFFPLLILCSLLVSLPEIKIAKAESTIYIREDGSIDPPTANITSLDNVTYTFTGNINGSIVVERNDIVVDGAGYTLQGSGTGRGIDLIRMSGQFPTPTGNVTVKNLRIVNFDRGIQVGPTNNKIIGNYIADCSIGIRINGGSNNAFIKNNTIANNVNCVSVFGNLVNPIITENNMINDVVSSNNVLLVWMSLQPTVDRNYWSDYEDRYPNATEVDGSGVWGTPYNVITSSQYVTNPNNQDNHPLVNPVAVAGPPDIAPPTISIVSPENKSYTANNVSLTFTVNELTSWIWYSLDDRASLTIAGNTTLTELSDGRHSLSVYAEDFGGNIGASETVYFTITHESAPFPTWIVAVIVIIAIGGAVLLIYLAKFRRTKRKLQE